ncbi:MAG: aminoglycoside phosphotransferase family protein [Pirellulales bacterium]|nr:aminoglycoside phosphotransferase family protein [Pirellulales bacterium]
MWELTADNAASYLHDRGWIGRHEQVDVASLPGGVSNEVLYVARRDAGAPDLVLKQSRPRLRVAQEWRCGVERIWREVAVLRCCEAVLAGRDQSDATALQLETPRVLHEDRQRYVIAISAAPREHRVWKADLLDGRVELPIAAACGRLLACLHAETWHDSHVARALGDTAIFDQLRLDPYFRAVARARPDAAADFERLIEVTLAERHALVHADFSPKNLLVWDGGSQRDGGLLMVDFETGHYGDPAFDLGFFLTHLVAKAVHLGDRRMLDLADAFWQSYRPAMLARLGEAEFARLVARGLQCLAGCLWARVDGKSPLEYITSERHRATIRNVAQAIFAERPTAWAGVVRLLDASEPTRDDA